MPKPMRVAGEVDGYCTRCRLLLNHRIVSMDRGKPHQVECLTCRTTHMWRPAAPGTGVGSSARAASPRREGRAHAAPAAARHERRWEEAIAGRGVRDFKAYSVAASFSEGDLVRHKKFGDGLVTRVIDANKVEVLFRDEARTLAHGLVS